MSRAVLAFFLSGSMTLAVGPNALPAKPSSPFMGAYVHMPAVFDEAKDPDSCRRLIARSLDQFQASGLCMVMPYATTTGGAAMYASRIISNRPCADCDPLAVFIKEARKRAVWARIKIRPNARNARSYRAIPRDAARHGTAPNDRMGPEGHEHFAKSPAKTQIHEPGGAKSGAL
ncbi:MAG: hypothetical protein JW741_11775, partial [Sedimentisphaerales bacterium]|nr:hypothetical protein [Sedimentisphaerales bacterium]